MRELLMTMMTHMTIPAISSLNRFVRPEDEPRPRDEDNRREESLAEVAREGEPPAYAEAVRSFRESGRTLLCPPLLPNWRNDGRLPRRRGVGSAMGMAGARLCPDKGPYLFESCSAPRGSLVHVQGKGLRLMSSSMMNGAGVRW